MDKKIIFFDIDGTLLDEKTLKVPESTVQAIKLARENGHICIVNTGRPSCTIDPVIKEVGFDGYIYGCGTQIVYHNQEITHNQLNQAIRKHVIELSFECKVYSVLEGKYSMYFPNTLRNDFVKEFKHRYVQLGFPINDYCKDDIVEFDKLTVWYDDESDIDRFRKGLENDFDIIQRDIDFVEIVPKCYSKAGGIQKLIDYLGMSIDQTISIGDSTNDLTMLTYTKESVAMGNSNPILFDKVTYCTTDISHDGIYNALKHFKII